MNSTIPGLYKQILGFLLNAELQVWIQTEVLQNSSSERNPTDSQPF